MNEVLKKIISEGKDLTLNSQDVKKGSIFIAIVGLEFDGRDYIEEAIKNGASAVIYESANYSKNKAWNVPSFGIENLNQKIAEIAELFFQNPSQSIKVIGVTGTNGKTSVVGWLQQCFSSLNQSVGSIGTLGSGEKNLKKTLNTTPDTIALNRILNDFKKKRNPICSNGSLIACYQAE